MPSPFDVYSDPDMILALYQDPESEVLLAEYALSTGGVQMGFVPASGAGSSGVLAVTEIQGTGGSSRDNHPCFTLFTPVRMADGSWKPIREVMPNEWVLAFDKATGRRVPGLVKTHFIHGATKFWAQMFEDGRETETTFEHRYWLGGGEFRSIGEIEDYIWHWSGTDWVRCGVGKGRYVESQKPFLLHNLEVDIWRTYEANGDGVSNLKPNEPILE